MTRVALITGGSRGIGFSFAQALLGAGYKVLITAARDAARLEAAHAALAADFKGAIASCVADVSVADHAKAAVDHALDRFGRLDILVNNAGRGPREVSETFHVTPPRFWDIAPQDWAQIVATNVNGPYLMARAAAPLMMAQGWGRIIGVSTSRVTMVRPGFAPYGPSKAALDTLTAIMAKELMESGVTANILLPGGATETDFIPQDGRSGHYQNLLPPDVMNEALLWLCSAQADAVTGARIVGKLWNPEDPAAAREDCGDPPRIL